MKEVGRFFGSLLTSQGGWSPWLLWVAVAVGVLLVFSLGLWVGSQRLKRDHPGRVRLLSLGRWGSALFMLGLLVIGVRYQRALYLSSPLVFVGWLVLFGWWCWSLVFWRLRLYPAERERYRELQRRGRWLKGRSRSR